MSKPNKQLEGFIYVFDSKCVMHSNDIKIAPTAPPPPNPNTCIQFGEKNSDEDIVYNSKQFNHEIETLLNNSNKSRLAEKNVKKGTNKIPRRQNAWILYRRDKAVEPQFHKMKSCIISKKITKMWEKEPNNVKEIYKALSRLAEKRHIEKHGKNYRYRPNRKPKEEDQIDNCSETSRTNSPTTSNSSDFEEKDHQHFDPTQNKFEDNIQDIINFPIIDYIEFENKTAPQQTQQFNMLSSYPEVSFKYNSSSLYSEYILQNPIEDFSNYLKHLLM
ncbi:14369_t:CDS:1 [Funneliformis geosporum]|uniref:1361_t:CDS:1 n=1 Tax=Funneliformis geosporum TaxID=1117311 RepID=A0A9W4SM26_9GLOM|nr:1361_t:CDS:1 [Funneliformis geosporum]CAI2179657.1 14369_t:CDS:1 [Funneliformis geosporum]